MAQSRTLLSIKNSVVALGFYLVNLMLQFYSRQVFFVELGTEVLGLNTTATSLLQFLNLAELGVGSAIGVTLYKPLLEKNYTAINEIVSLQGWLYKRIAYFIIIGSAVLMCFFPWLFNKSELPLWYAYTSYSVLLFSAILGYFVNYKQIVLSANQQEYFVRCSYNACMIIKVITQIIAMKLFSNAYILWLVLEVVFAIIASVALAAMVRKKCPYLKTNTTLGKELKTKYPDVLIKVKQMFFHKASRYALTQTSPLIIYAYATLTLVAIYGNYMLIVTGLTALLTAMFDSMSSGVGNLVAEGNRGRIISVFRELFSSRFLLVSVFSFCLFFLAAPFVDLWIGDGFNIDKVSLLFIVLIFYLNTSRSVVDSYINAYGLFRDIWAPVIEATINLSLSILLGYYYGLPGILAGVAISLLLVVFCWKPFFLFKAGLKTPIKMYVLLYFKHMAVFIVSSIIVYYVLKLITIKPGDNYLSFVGYSVIMVTLLVSVEGGLLYSTEIGFRNFVSRIINVKRNK